MPGNDRKIVHAFENSTLSIDEAAITLMHVVEKPWLRLSWEKEWPPEFERSYAEAAEQPEDERLFARELRREAEQIVEEARHFSARSLAVESHIAEGNPANEILMSLKSESTT